MEVRGFEPRASRMQSERSTTELHPQYKTYVGSVGRYQSLWGVCLLVPTYWLLIRITWIIIVMANII